MKQHVEIIYDEIQESDEYNKIINRVINECFNNENLSDLSLYISVTLTTPEKIHIANKKYRNVDRATDVLSFPMFEKEEIQDMVNNLESEEKNSKSDDENFSSSEILGDLIISIPRVYEQADEYGHSFERELSYMCVHGFYHLMGYDHIKEEDKKVMRKKEDEVLNKLNITRD